MINFKAIFLLKIAISNHVKKNYNIYLKLGKNNLTLPTELEPL